MSFAKFEEVAVSRSLGELLDEDSSIRVIGINRKGDALRIFDRLVLESLKDAVMVRDERWQAWSMRFPVGSRSPFQQICVFDAVQEVER
jgi:hypothetical protein